SPVRPWITLLDGRSLGYIQSYVAAEVGSGWWPEVGDPGVLGIDFFLADPARLGRGLGTAIVQAFVERLLEDPTVTRVQADPAPDNRRSIRCLEKAGFRRSGPVTTPDGPAILMVLERS
ncbi:MAG: GNAT family N-acetyltransferase, partial [Gemmatimonadetes bacterium]|nr:GNAT family N-acetyltransferase [Gemmatimonadota bacterium]NIR76857.1 GNAT family N-acetyltransferase [Gemmatimonadota bacterium]NIT85376.1 GNAT family N-acetyltransferase [Gemmatimonadota bacterium]NIU29197.1 GNAT family N-acetyltransferase [Gemmatimonadota bacterium]NIU34294.1 GNAT family N-acetyltransferase [Gemmatimonadota bacterium]